MDQVRIIGPRTPKKQTGETVINTTSKGGIWADLSPFKVGPCPLYDDRVALRHENAYQFAKVYAKHADASGAPTEAYWSWAEAGWADSIAHRYPMGRGAKPLYSLWDGERLDYIAARKRIYFPIYRDAVAKSEGWRKLKELCDAGTQLALWDYDGYDHTAFKVSLGAALNDPKRIFGHSFVLKAMLLYGEHVEPGSLH